MHPPPSTPFPRGAGLQGQEGRAMTYQIRGDSLVITDPQGGFAAGMTFGIEKDGTLSLGVPGSLTKRRS